MKNMIALVLATTVGGVALAALPKVTVGTLTQDAVTKRVTIPYALTGEDACIVTVDVLTNGPAGWVSIGGERLSTLWGDVNMKLAVGDGEKTIYWNPATAGFQFALSDLKAEVSVWSLANPPDYMVLDLSGSKKHRFYPHVGQIPLGVTNDVYKTDYLVMRKIPAAGVTWRMGAGENESPIEQDKTIHLVTLKEDYYIGVYEVTQGQMANVGHKSVINDCTTFKDREDSYLRPIDGVSWFNIRYKSTWPSGGHEFGQYTYFNQFHTTIGNIQFDLPTEAQWEYACRAGTKTKYNNGSSTDIDSVAWYVGNSTNEVTGLAETHPVGLKEPNPWGLYDMIGNVREWCLDYYKQDFGINDVDYDDDDFNGPTACDAGLTTEGNARVLKGGCYSGNSLETKSAARNWGGAGAKSANIGFRVCCPVAYPL